MPLSHKLIQDKFLLPIFFLFGLFPLLPFSLKPIPIIVALFFGIYTFIINKKLSFSKLHIISSLLFFIYVGSIVYSTDKDYALKRLETTFSMFIIPLIFILLSSIDIKNKNLLKYEFVFQITFYVSSILFCLIMFAYIWQLGYYNNKVTYDYSISYIEQDLWGLNDHPIYVSIFLSISLIFSFKLYSKKNLKILIILGNILLVWTLIFLSRKAILLGVLIACVFLMSQFIKSIKHKFLILLFISIGSSTFYLIQPSSFNRIREAFNSETYTQPIDEDNSTSVRLYIYKCAFQNVTNAGMFGYGIGDVKNVLLDCYKNTSPILVKWNYNTHNQYLNTILACGLVGLLIFVFILFKFFHYAFLKNDYMFLSILIFYVVIMITENVLDRQNGVLLYALLINFYIFRNHQNSKHLNA